MLVSALLLLTGFSMGFGLSLQFLHPFLTVWECLSVAAPLGLTVSTWIAVILKSTLFRSVPGLPSSIGLVVLLLQSVFTLFSFSKQRKQWNQTTRQNALDQLYFFLPSFILLLFYSAWIALLHYTHSLLEENGKYHVGGTVYGDLPFHLTIITSILHGCNEYATPLTSGLKAAFFADSPLVYPWIPDYHAAFIAGSGSTLHFALCMPGILLTTSFFFLMFFFYFRFTNSRLVASIAVPITFFTGGIGGFYWLLYDRSWAGLVAEDHILMNALTRRIEFYWFSLPAHILFPQRTTQFAYSMSFVVLIIIHKAYTSSSKAAIRSKALLVDETEKKVKQEKVNIMLGNIPTELEKLWLFGAAGFATGLLPLLQVHSFAAIGLVILTIAVIHVVQLIMNFIRIYQTNPTVKWAFMLANGNQLKWWLVYGVVSWGIGMPQNAAFFSKVLFPSHPESSQSFLRFMLISNDFPPQPNIILLWLQALGLYIPLYCIAIIFFRKNSVQLQFQSGFILLFLVSNVVIFQPWVLDNTKVFYIAIFGLSPMIAQLLVYLWSWNPFRRENQLYEAFASAVTVKAALRVLLIVAFLSLIFSGVLCTIRETDSYMPMYERKDIELAHWFYENTPTDARIVVATRAATHFRPASALGGRTLISSYWGWISNHGMPNYAGQNHASNEILDGNGRAMENLRDLRVDYIVLDWQTLHTYNLEFIHSVAYRVAGNGKYIVYKVIPWADLEVVDCVTPGERATKSTCAQKGCIWVEGAPGAWCQKPPIWGDAAPVVSDCGWFGIESHSCHNIGCSFFSDYDGPHCQMPLGVDDSRGRGAMCNLLATSSTSLDCQQSSEYQCKDRGCIWSPNNNSEPYCKLPYSTYNTCDMNPSFAVLFGL